MYEAFYGLREKPFNLTPDPKYLYLSEKHKEAFAHLLFGIKNRSGFVMVTGEIGTGKTTICRNLLNQIDDDTEVAFIFNPALDPVELLKKINHEFGIDATPNTALELIEVLNQALLDAAIRGKNCVLVIDEAQNLAPNVLEQIRLLSNLETETEKLLQIILIGQPELAEKLALYELRQLNQRITARYHLKPLDEHETFQYIAYRLHVAGARRKVSFDRNAVKEVFKRSGGTPRVINAICDRALLIGYTREAQTISRQIVIQAAREIKGERIIASRPQSGWNRYVPNPSWLVAAAVVLAIAYPLNRIATQWGNTNTILSGGRPAGGIQQAEARAIPVEEEVQPPPAPLEVLDRIAANAPAAKPEAAPALEPNDDATFPQTLAALEPEDARRAASDALLRAWSLPLLTQHPSTDDPRDLVTFSRGHGFSAEQLTPALDQLLSINLPAFVRMEHAGEQAWLALLDATDDEYLKLSTAKGETATISREVFRKYYASEALVLWRDPSPKTPTLMPGGDGSAVARLKEGLRQLGRIQSTNTSDKYDQETANAIARIQAETGLPRDGIAGKQVRMILFSWLPNDNTPSLLDHQVHAALVKRDIPEPAAPAPEAAAAPVPAAPVAAPAPATEAPRLSAPPAEAPDTALADARLAPEETEAEPAAVAGSAPALDQTDLASADAVAAQDPAIEPVPQASENEALPTWSAVRAAAAAAEAAAGNRAVSPTPAPASRGWIQVAPLEDPQNSPAAQDEQNVTPPATGAFPLVPSPAQGT